MSPVMLGKTETMSFSPCLKLKLTFDDLSALLGHFGLEGVEFLIGGAAGLQLLHELLAVILDVLGVRLLVKFVFLQFEGVDEIDG